MEQQQCSLEDLEIMGKLSDKLAGFFGRLFPMSRNKTIKLNNEIRQTESEHFAQLCEMLGVSRALAYKLISDDEIQAVKIGTSLKIPKVSVINYVTEEKKEVRTSA